MMVLCKKEVRAPNTVTAGKLYYLHVGDTIYFKISPQEADRVRTRLKGINTSSRGCNSA
jgi:hypothetical protein